MRGAFSVLCFFERLVPQINLSKEKMQIKLCNSEIMMCVSESCYRIQEVDKIYIK